MSHAKADPVALVVGASSGIGRGVAHRLSSDGFRVAATARGPSGLDALARELPGPSTVLASDLSDSDAAERTHEHIRGTWGEVDVLVLAGGSATSAPLGATSDEQWSEMVDVHLSGPFRYLRRLTPGMAERGFGRVVVVASVAGRRGEPYVAAYVAAKHGVVGLVRAAAAELGRSGVTVNAVCPGYVDTPMTDRTVAAVAERTGRSEQEARATLARRQGNGRLVEVDEVCDAVMLCVRNPAINGQAIVVDGGSLHA